MRWGRVRFRVYGQVRLTDPAILAELRHALPDGATTLNGDTLDIDHEGGFFDIQDFLEAAARLLPPDQAGNLDVFDDDTCTVTRYELTTGGHSAVCRSYDDILEHTKNEGNW